MRTLEELPAPLAATSTNRCPNCGARMAPDQRYCIDCGERRSGGGLRDALPRAQATVTAARTGTGRIGGWSPNASLIAGVATLLIAMGVGVLIGRSGHTTAATPAAAPVRVVTVGAGAGAATTSSATAAGTGSTSSAAKSSKKHRRKASSSASTSTGGGDIQKTAAKNGVKLPPPVVKVGGKCTSGAKGCQGGKFTGNFFGGG